MNKQTAISKLEEAILKEGNSRSTMKTYRGYLARYIDGLESGKFSCVRDFIDHLCTSKSEKVNPKTVHQAACALVFFYKHVLNQDPGKFTLPRINRNRNQPTWLHHDEVIALLSHMRGIPRLQASILYGTGSRIRAMLTLRLKDLDLRRGLVTFRFDKGGKSRTVNLPKVLIPAITEQLDHATARWELDQRNGICAGSPDPSLERKLGKTTLGKLPWYWLFPSQTIREKTRWHSTDRALCKAIAKAAQAARITKRVTAHTLRHSHATALLQNGVNIRAIQDQLGHTHVQTTEIYTHTLATEKPQSPLDALNVIPFSQPLKTAVSS